MNGRVAETQHSPWGQEPCLCVPYCTCCPAPCLVHRKVSKCLSHEWMWEFVKPGHKATLQVLIHFARKEMQGQFCSKGILQEWEDRWPSVSHPCVRVCSVAQLCLTLCDPTNCSPPGSSVHEILQARVLEWVAIAFSGGSSLPRDRTQVSCIADKCFTIWATRLSSH